MGMSLYYNANRETPITEQEQTICQEIANRYCFEYPFDTKYEDFCIYESNEEPNIIFSGSTKLPLEEPEFMFDVASYWLKCLTEITNALQDCEWTVTFEDIDLILDENEGWCFPTDEE